MPPLSPDVPPIRNPTHTRWPRWPQILRGTRSIRLFGCSSTSEKNQVDAPADHAICHKSALWRFFFGLSDNTDIGKQTVALYDVDIVIFWELYMLSGRDIYSWLSLCDPEVLPHDTPPPDGPCYPRMCHLAVGRWTRPTNTGDPHPTNTVYTCIEILTKWNPQIQIWGMLGFAVAPWGFADSEFPAQIQTNVLLTFIYILSHPIF